MTKFKDKMNSYKKHPGSFLLFLLVVAAAILTVAVLLYLVAYILIHGVPYLKPGLFALEYNSDNVSMLPAMINTLEMTLFSLLFAVPLGIGAAVYLVEYAPKGSKLVKVVRITAETLTGIPSIIYGLFGMLFFVTYLHWGYSMLAGAATLAIMVLPVIMRTTEEALLCVPDTAALIYTAGTVADLAPNLMASGRTLAVHMYSLSREGLHTNEAYATGVVLLVIVLLINGVSTLIAGKFTKGDGEVK